MYYLYSVIFTRKQNHPEASLCEIPPSGVCIICVYICILAHYPPPKIHEEDSEATCEASEISEMYVLIISLCIIVMRL